MNKFLDQVSYFPFFDKESGSGSGGGQASGGGEENKDESPKWAKDLGAAVGQLNQGITELLNIGKQRQQQPTPPEDEDEGEEGDTEVRELTPRELESLSRAEFAQYIRSQIVKTLEDTVVKPIGNRIQQTETQVIADRTAREVGELMSKHPDYWEWKDEMVAMAGEHPTLSAERIYKLVQSENPAKAAELAKKYAKHEDDPANGGKGREGQKSQAKNGRSFGGLPPRGSGSSTPNKKMAPVEAALAAWDSVTSEMGLPDHFSEE